MSDSSRLLPVNQFAAKPVAKPKPRKAKNKKKRERK